MDTATGLIYVGNGQYYDPSTGRFLNRNARPDQTNPYVPWKQDPASAMIAPLAILAMIFSRKKKHGKWDGLMVSIVLLLAVGLSLSACAPEQSNPPVFTGTMTVAPKTTTFTLTHGTSKPTHVFSTPTPTDTPKSTCTMTFTPTPTRSQEEEDWEFMETLSPELKPVYETYVVLKYYPGWWNDEQAGTFTLLDLLEKLLWMEASDKGHEIDDAIWQEMAVRNFYFRTSTYIGKPASSTSLTDVLTYITRKSMATGAGREVLLKRGMDPNSVWIDRPGPTGYNRIDFSSAFLSHLSVWEDMPWVDDTRPMEFGNVSMIPPKRSDEARGLTRRGDIPLGTEENQFYATTLARTGNFAIIFNYRQLKYWYDTSTP